MKCSAPGCRIDAQVYGYCWLHSKHLYLSHEDVCEAWDLMKQGASLKEAAAMIGTISSRLNLSLNRYQGYDKTVPQPAPQPEPMFQ